MSQESARITHIEGVADGIECIAADYRSHKFTPHFHDTYVVGVVTSGAARTHYRGENVVVRAGTIFVIEPGEVHGGEPHGDAGYSYRAFYPSIAEMRASGRGSLLRPRFSQLAYVDEPLAARMATLHEAVMSGVHDASAVAGMFRTVVQRYGEVRVGEECAERRAVRLAREHVDANYARQVPLATLAEMSGMSTFHLIRVFRREVGLPPGMYLQLVRIRHASEMLRAGVPISHVAYAAGFSDQSHLTRRFRRIVGVTPGEYARCTRATAAPLSAA